MLARLAALGEDVGVVTAGVFQGVGKDGQAVEGPVVVDGLGELDQGGVVPDEPGRVDGNGAEWVGEDFVEQSSLNQSFCIAVCLKSLVSFSSLSPAVSQ